MILEKEIERKLTAMIHRHGGLCLKWVCPGWSGVPDRILLFPGGRVYFVELKRSEDSKVAPLQIWWRRRLEGLGFTVWHVYTAAHVANLDLILANELNGHKGE